MNEATSVNRALEVIISGIQAGDDNGGPSQVSSLLSESLAQKKAFDPHDIANQYLNWWQSGAFDTGPVFALVFSTVSKSMEQDKAVREADALLDGGTAGCNPAHRIAPLAAFPFIKTEDIPSIARLEARLTHWHPHAGDAASIVALLCRFMIEGNNWETSKALTERSDSDGWQVILDGRISDGGYAPDVVRTAIHFLDEGRSLEQAKLFAGPANYSPVLVGVFNALI